MSEKKLPKKQYDDQTENFSAEFDKTGDLKGMNRSESRLDSKLDEGKKRPRESSHDFEYEDSNPNKSRGKGHRQTSAKKDELENEFQDEDPFDSMTDHQQVKQTAEDGFEDTAECQKTEIPDNSKIQGERTKVKDSKPRKVQKPRKLSFETSKKPDFSLNGLIFSRMDEYDGLRDENLQVFFAKNNRKRILVKNGLITEDGYIVKKPDEYLKKRDLYFKTNGQGEESTHVRAKTFEKKKVNPYKENIAGPRQESKGKASKGLLPPKTNGKSAKFDLKNANR
jgi:hypothetical protein